MSDNQKQLAELAAELAEHTDSAEKLWVDVQANMKDERAMRRYCASLRLCERIKNKIKKMTTS